jgi:hypothetical protein
MAKSPEAKGSNTVVLAEPPAPRRLRKWEERPKLAEHISDAMFTVSHRTLETWPVRMINIHKRTLLNTAETLDHARKLLAEAEAGAVRGGRATTARGSPPKELNRPNTDDAACPAVAEHVVGDNVEERPARRHRRQLQQEAV